jgi:hypothetical protein
MAPLFWLAPVVVVDDVGVGTWPVGACVTVAMNS